MDIASNLKVVLPRRKNTRHSVFYFLALGGLNFESQYKPLATSLAVYTIPGDYYSTLISDSSIPSEFSKNFVHLRVRGYSNNIFQEIRSLISPNVVYIRSKTSANEFGEWIKMS